MGEKYIEQLNKRIDYWLEKFLASSGSKDGQKYADHYNRLMKHYQFINS